MAGRQDIEAGKAYVTLYVKNSALVKGLKDAEARLKGMGKSIIGVGKTFLAGGAAIAAPLAAAAALFAETGSKLDKMAQRTATGTNALSELGYAAKKSGADVEQIESALTSMNSTLAAAGRFDSGAIQSLARLGTTLEQLQGMTKDQQFEVLADRISRVQDPAERAARAVAIFGGAGQALLPMLNKGKAGIRALREEAEALGLSVGPEQAKAAAQMVEAWTTVKQAIKGVVMSIGGALAPSANEALGITRDIVVNVSKWVRANSQAAVTIAKIALGLVAAGAAVVAFGAAIWGLGAAFGALATAATVAAGIVGALWGVITAPAVLAVAAIVGIGLAIAKWTKAFDGAKAAGKQALGGLSGLVREAMGWFSQFADDATAAWQGVTDAIAAGDLGLAAEVAVAGLKAAFARVFVAVNEGWQASKEYFLTAWNDAATTAQSYLVDSLAVVQTSWVNASAGISATWTAMIAGIKYALLSLAEPFEPIIQVVMNLEDRAIAAANSFGEAWMTAATWVNDKIVAAFNAIRDHWDTIVSALLSAWQGMTDAMGAAFGGMIDRIKPMLGPIMAAVDKITGAADKATATSGGARLDIKSAKARVLAEPAAASSVIEDERKKRLADIEAGRQKSQVGLQDRSDAERKRIADARQQSTQAALAELEEAKKRLADAAGRAGAAGKSARDKRAAQQAAAGAGPAINFESMKTVAGTFSAQAASSMGGAGPRNLERLSADQLKVQKDHLKVAQGNRQLFDNLAKGLKVSP